MAYSQVEPFGEERADLRIAKAACQIANLFGRGKDQQPFEMSDFILKFDPPKEQTEEQMKLFLGIKV